MQYREKSGQNLVEPLTVDEFKDYTGFSGTSQDGQLLEMITAARKWFEDYTGMSIVSKSYEARFYYDDAVDDYFTLPVAPVSSITTVEVSGNSTSYDQKGLDIISIRPYQTVIASSSTDEDYVDVEFIAVASETQITQARLALLRILNDWWDNRKDNSPVEGPVSWDTMRLVDSLKIIQQI
jgi:uncharacterized phiE125 gp8 family phage protein